MGTFSQSLLPAIALLDEQTRPALSQEDAKQFNLRNLLGIDGVIGVDNSKLSR
jgi:hypothetical protein